MADSKRAVKREFFVFNSEGGYSVMATSAAKAALEGTFSKDPQHEVLCVVDAECLAQPVRTAAPMTVVCVRNLKLWAEATE
jgi:hypothetical protein